ncbi:MAG TPA: glycosyltransferase [Bacteroidales bacterium]|nr:glycosyltransferase [Bacteroidales bacterium]
MESRRLNILFISSWYPTRIGPTAGNFVQKHAEAAALYAHVDVLHVALDRSLGKKYEYQQELRNNVTSHIIYLRYPKINLPLFKLFRYVHAYFFGYKKMYAKSEKPDIVHANVLVPVGLIAFLFHVIKKIPYVISEHWTAYLPQDPNKPGRKLFLYRYFAKRSAMLMPVTAHLAKAMENLSVRGNYAVVPNVVDTSLFMLSPAKTGDKKHIIHVSSLLDVQKNFSGILLALSHLKDKRDDFVLDVISDGDFEQYQPKYEKLNIGDKIVFHGRKSTEEVAAIMQKGDFLLLFSNYENFPCVIAEAMACGLPVLSSDVGGIAEHVSETTGILLEAQNIDELIVQLSRMLDTCRGYDKNSIRAYAEKHFSYDVVGKQFYKIYKQASCS